MVGARHCLEDLDVPNATFGNPDLATFTRLAELGLEAVGQQITAERATGVVLGIRRGGEMLTGSPILRRTSAVHGGSSHKFLQAYVPWSQGRGTLRR